MFDRINNLTNQLVTSEPPAAPRQVTSAGPPVVDEPVARVAAGAPRSLNRKSRSVRRNQRLCGRLA